MTLMPRLQTDGTDLSLSHTKGLHTQKSSKREPNAWNVRDYFMGRTITVQRGLLKRKATNDERQLTRKDQTLHQLFHWDQGLEETKYTTNEMLLVSPKSSNYESVGFVGMMYIFICCQNRRFQSSIIFIIDCCLLIAEWHLPYVHPTRIVIHVP